MKMKNKIFKLEAAAEINEIFCSLYDASLNVIASEDKQLKVTFPDCKNVSVAVGEKRLIINQSKRLIPIGRQIVTVSVPTHVVPSLSITGNRISVSLVEGIFGDLSLNGVCGELSLINSSFASVEVVSGDICAHLSETTVKESLYMQIEKGQLLAENSFAFRADCHLKHGNMGLINLSGGDFTFETENGNITLTLAGAEEEYNTLLRVKSGTSNKPSTQNEGAQKTVKAFSENGNVLIDFVGQRVDICEAAVADGLQDDTQTDDADGDLEKTL
ncbi:MAG: DUF4097 family beta strand repeat-containing protein [Candidatus Coproplasma sp.]